jgi:hypothetical protein
MNRKNLFSIFYKTENANFGRYANADKFIRCATVIGKDAMQEKLAELKAANVKIDSIYNGIGEKIKF